MTIFSKILIPVEYSIIDIKIIDNAIKTAIKCNCNEIDLLCVIDPNAVGFFATPESGLSIGFPMLVQFENSVKEKMNTLHGQIKEKYNITVSSSVSVGTLLHTIEEYVEENEINLIIMNAEYKTGVGEFMFGSKAQRISSKITCPVLTIQPSAQIGEINKIVLPIENFYPQNKMQYVLHLAKLFKAEIHLLILRNTLQSAFRQNDSILSQVTADLNIEEIRNITIVLNSENITDAILEYAEKEGVDLILVNPGDESKLTGRFIETTGGNIVNHTPVPVLTIKKRKI